MENRFRGFRSRVLAPIVTTGIFWGGKVGSGHFSDKMAEDSGRASLKDAYDTELRSAFQQKFPEITNPSDADLTNFEQLTLNTGQYPYVDAAYESLQEEKLDGLEFLLQQGEGLLSVVATLATIATVLSIVNYNHNKIAGAY